MATAGKVINCKAAVLYKTGEKFVVETIQVAPPKEHEVRIKIISSGYCGGDEGARLGDHDPIPIGPIVLGHEGAGIVESVGPGVTTCKPGDHVIPTLAAFCGKCRTCLHPSNSNQCETIKFSLGNGVLPFDNKPRFSKDGKDIYHYFLTGTLSQYTVVHELCVAKINPAAPLDKVFVFGCAVPSGHGAAVKVGVFPGSTAVVFGLGGVGISAVLACRNLGAKHIIGVDRNPKKIEIAKKCGCTDIINTRQLGGKTVEEIVHEITGGGADFAIECIGSLDTMKSAIDSTHPTWGKIIFVGAGKLTVPLPVDYFKLMFGRQLMGSAYGNYRGQFDLPKLVEEYLQGKLVIDDMVTHSLPLEKMNDIFDIMKTGTSVRVRIDMW